jgi:broad specificity phosphatase PhoE
LTRRTALALLLCLLLAPLSARAQDAAGAGAPLRVYVIRHAQAWKNVPASLRPRKMSEQELDALTGQGLVRALEIGKELAGRDVAAVYASPARRARQTAEAIAKGLGLPEPVASEAFRPLDTGSDHAAASGTARMKSWKAGEDPRPPGGESLGDGFARASRELEALRAKYAGRAIAVVTHGEISASLLAKAAGEDIVKGYFDHFPDEGSIHAIEVTEAGLSSAAR